MANTIKKNPHFQKFVKLSEKCINGKFHNWLSLTFLFFVLPTILWKFPATPINSKRAKISVVKKSSDEEVFSLYGTHLNHKENQPGFDRKGYVISEAVALDCNAINPIPNAQTTILLDNLHNKCLLTQRLSLASRAGYSALIFYNFTHLNLKNLQQEKIKGLSAVVIKNEDAVSLLKFTFPKSVRFYVGLSSCEDIFQWLFQLFNSDEIPILKRLIVFKTDKNWILNAQAYLYGLLFFFIWRWCLVPKKFSIFRYLKGFIRDESMFSILKCDDDATKTPLHLFILKMSQRKIISSNSYFDINRIIHDPWSVKISKEDFVTNCAVGYGSFGKVTEEKFLRTGETVAIKSIVKLESVSKLEADILAYGNCCDGIVKLLYGFVSPLHVHFVMEILIGSLKDFMEDLRIPHAKVYAVELGLALEALHDIGVCHRDLKPANIMLDTKYHVKLGDFGCARLFQKGQQIITEEHYLGTEAYWAPENYQKQWTLESDWWAYGCVLFELFSRQHQFFLWSKYMHNKLKHGDYTDDLTKRRISEAISQSMCLSEAKILIRQCLSKDPCRKPFAIHDKCKGRAGPMRFVDMKEFLSVPIPVNQSVNIFEEFRLNSGKSPEWEVVPESTSNVSKQAEQFKVNERIYQNFFCGMVESKMERFYFDHQDLNCFKDNSVIGKYFS